MTRPATWTQRVGGDLVTYRAWTDDERAEAVRMRRAGFGSTLIGKRLGRTKNAVVGELWRLGEPGVLVNQTRVPKGVGRWARADPPKGDVSPPRKWSWEVDDAQT